MLVYKPKDVFFELLRTQLYDYRNAIQNNRKMSKVEKRFKRIKFIYELIEQLKLESELEDCF